MSVHVLIAEIRWLYGIEVSWRKTHRARLKAIDRIRGSLAESYSLLPKYCTTLLASNPRSIVKLHAPLATVDDTYGTFKRVFICLAACKNIFLEGCRKIVGLDGYHIKIGAIGGVILLVVGLDGNNDKQKGIVDGVAICMLGANHRFCMWHLYSNFKKLFMGKALRDALWAAGKSYTQTDFAHCMEIVKSCFKEAYDWLCKIPPTTWSRHGFDPIVKSDDITNNWTKLFNSWIGESWSLPIVEMLEGVRKRLMQKLFERHEAVNAQASVLMPRVESIISTRGREARSVRVFRSRHYEYQTRGNDLVDNVTKMDAKTCTCRVWDISGISCYHALAVLTYTRGIVEELCDVAFHKSTYSRVYSHLIHALPGQKYLAPVDYHPVRPPTVRRRPGRPPISRRREEDEASPSHHGPLERKTIRCSICGGTGHNRRNCRASPPSGNNTNVQVDVSAPEQAQTGWMVRRKLSYIMRGV
ncbi:PREDICTED: uncharacterized protein LOC104613346 [Nelumbo nucifera]|uniref:Uncharacterized protein LOC104613346 n=1 Tax=Nelumbo nucifera TaxID=4432 RepID=A0A1U8BGW5_NELNU|nr:PREDICTED: uncharacterized protein LOC104613346 [Nelumbo nucifera]